MTKIRFDCGTVTISDGFVQAPSPTLTAILDTLAATLPDYGSIPFILDEDFNIAQGLIEKVAWRPRRVLDTLRSKNFFRIAKPLRCRAVGFVRRPALPSASSRGPLYS